MGKRPDPLFLERGSYRERRLLDAVRLVVVLGALLWIIPVLWPNEGAAQVPMSTALFYVFGVWVVLIVISAVLASRRSVLRDGETEDRPEQGP